MASEYLNNKTFEEVIQAFQVLKQQQRRYEFVIEDLRETHQRRVSKYKDNVKRAQLNKKIAQYEQTCDEFKQCQEQLAEAFYVLSKNLANYVKSMFNSGTDIDDAVQEGVLICFEKVDRFNPNYRGKNGQKAKAFNYMTTCILNHYRQLYRSAKNYHELKRKYHNFLQEKFESVFFRNGKERTKVS